MSLFFEGDPEKALAEVDAMMRELSTHTEPQELVNAYGERVRRITGNDATVSLSRRNLEKPKYRITRSSLWEDDINPWEQQSRLPLFDHGLLGELLYADKPTIINDFRPDPSDPAFEHFAPYRSLFAIPQYDNGVATNMVVSLKKKPDSFKLEQAPMLHWMANLFGRSVHALVMAKQLKQAYSIVDKELKAVAEIQRSLLPAVLPDVRNLRLAAHYQTSQQAGGDYYDLFPLDGGKLGMLIADVSGHGTPAAVLMAITHTVAHAYPGQPLPPASLLRHLNEKLVESYVRTPGGFVTAFYGVYDPGLRSLTYSTAGHNPPRVKRDDRIISVDGARELPLGIQPGLAYREETVGLDSGDTLLLYTDGITEARAPSGPLFGETRLDDVLRSSSGEPDWTIQNVIDEVDKFTSNSPATDDRTLVAAKVL